VILAHLSADRRADLLGGEALARYTPNTITDRVELEQNLAQIRQRGFAVDDGEHEESVRCLASPLFGADGRIVGAMSIATVSYRVSLPTLLSWWPILREHTAQLRAELVHYFDRYSER
jgi:DNA-binding IclR family transcriptional regulator